ncbi:MAG: glycosyltransferase family 9 protein [Vulcanimicrobiota bacterium]
MKRSYSFKSPRALMAVRLIDAAGYSTLGVLRRFSSVPLPDPESVKRILVVRLDHIGDVLMTTPFFEALNVIFPQAEVTALIGSWSRPILEGNPFVDTIITYNAPWFSRSSAGKAGFGDTCALISRMRREKYDIVFFPRSDDLPSITLAWLFAIPSRVGFGYGGGGFFLSKEIEYPSDRLQQVEASLSPLRKIYGEVNHSGPKIYLSSEDEEKAMKLIEGEKLSVDRLIAIHPGVSVPARQWYSDRFADVAAGLQHEGYDLLFLGSEGDSAFIEKIRQAMRKPAPSLAGKMDIKVLAAAIRQCRMIICLESLAGHLSASVGTPSVVIYGGTTPYTRFRPWGDNHALVQAPAPSCSPCYRIDCDDRKCMDGISAEMVLQAARELLTD